MPTEYDVRVRCETEGEYKRTTQTVLDPNWVPDGCGTHTIESGSFTIEDERTV